MKPNLLRVTLAVVEFEVLVAAVRHAGHRVGWLDLGDPSSEAPGPLPEELATAADLGALRAVSVAGGRSVAIKPLRGAPVLRDLVREHFRGCRLVLVRGTVEAPTLEPEDGGWRVRRADGRSFPLSTEELVTRLNRPQPWG